MIRHSVAPSLVVLKMGPRSHGVVDATSIVRTNTARTDMSAVPYWYFNVWKMCCDISVSSLWPKVDLRPRVDLELDLDTNLGSVYLGKNLI